MSISAVGSGSVAPPPQPAPKVDQPHDGDSDDVKPPVQAAPAPGTGKAVDKTA